jgi:pyridoxamine 5'-phosphate oxidase
LDLLTDGRSAKASESQNSADVEICWLLPRARSQFRLRAKRADLTAAELLRQRQQHWHNLTSSGRALWGWPEPGSSFEPEAPFPRQLNESTPIPSHFNLLSFCVNQVELLELGGHPHRRRRWLETTAWSEESLNP